MQFNKTILIENHVVSENSPTFVIAEAGVNHNGDIDTAKKLIDAAVAAGVNAVKFQMFKTEDLILKNIDKAPYQKGSTGTNQDQYEMLKQLEFEKNVFVQLKDYCISNGIIFLCTPFEESSLDILDDLGVPAFKVAATDITNLHFLKQIARKGKPMIISAGMCYLDEIRLALETVYPINRDVILLQCTANYPVSDNEVNLNVIDTLKDEFNILIGYSDHTKGIGAAPYAVAKGAKVIEKHFTLSRNMAGPDHMASIEPPELMKLTEDIRQVEQYLGSFVKTPTLSECFTRKSLQKCLVASTDIKKGELFTEKNITAKRTGGVGIPALYYDSLINSQSSHSYCKDDIITYQR